MIFGPRWFFVIKFLNVALFYVCWARPLLDVEKTRAYLVQYGYLNNDDVDNNELNNAIRRFKDDVGASREDVNLQVLNSLMKMSRCSQIYDGDGVEIHTDNTQNFSNQRKKRFVAHSAKWQFSDLKWRFRDPYNLFKDSNDFEVVRETISHALEMWSKASKRAIRFYDASYEYNASNLVNIDTFFATGDHGDHEAFDGNGGIVAHSGYPMVGKIHFDADELWTIRGDKGIDLRYVTLHETGHALGLRHSRNKEAVMYPIYKKNPLEIALSDDDAQGIKFLYGEGGPSGRHKRYRRPGKVNYFKRVDFEDEDKR